MLSSSMILVLLCCRSCIHSTSEYSNWSSARSSASEFGTKAGAPKHYEAQTPSYSNHFDHIVGVSTLMNRELRY
ncbi:hypothetical protein L873DRAFT_563849 [Choiromyces venosus 120613-1]|uniref:Secreted protein n=1 Tax=Choiromyces venosus 120613-1 TaxID=1336337 RepID=A0A3N4JY22_9PEZI|nr:hypothetical protein L873DRAFT_563849 [Choiromyces venosus 120613-1]